MDRATISARDVQRDLLIRDLAPPPADFESAHASMLVARDPLAIFQSRDKTVRSVALAAKKLVGSRVSGCHCSTTGTRAAELDRFAYLRNLVFNVSAARRVFVQRKWSMKKFPHFLPELVQTF